MVPSISAKYASLHETIVDDNGKNYIAKMVCGEMTWILHDNPGCPTISANIMSVGDVLMGTDNKEYIVMMSGNIKSWSIKTKKNNNKTKDQGSKSNEHPLILASFMNVGDILVGQDNNEYIVKIINGEKQYTVHQKIYKWSKSGVMYKTVDNSTTIDSGYCSRKKASKKKSNS